MKQASDFTIKERMQAYLKRFSYASAIGMFLILVMGALVTKTESGRGCGEDWPLCNGRFIPAYTIESLIEYNHRLVVGAVSMILLATALLVWIYSKRSDAKFYVSGALLFTLLQAVLGALAVVWPTSSAVLALHFGFSLIAFAFTLLLAIIYSPYGGKKTADGGWDSGQTEPLKLSSGLSTGIWLIAVYCYVVVYLGAFVRHTNSTAGCIGWPLCNGKLVPALEGATTIVFIHRVAAILFLVSVLALFLYVRKSHRGNANFYSWVRAALILTVLQVLSGGYLTYMIGHDWYLLASLLHTVLISCLFGLLSYLCMLTLQWEPVEGKGEGYVVRQSTRIS